MDVGRRPIMVSPTPTPSPSSPEFRINISMLLLLDPGSLGQDFLQPDLLTYWANLLGKMCIFYFWMCWGERSTMWTWIYSDWLRENLDPHKQRQWRASFYSSAPGSCIVDFEILSSGWCEKVEQTRFKYISNPHKQHMFLRDPITYTEFIIIWSKWRSGSGSLFIFSWSQIRKPQILS